MVVLQTVGVLSHFQSPVPVADKAGADFVLCCLDISDDAIEVGGDGEFLGERYLL